MLQLVVLIVFVSSAFGRYIQNENRIFGGNTATADQFPFQISIRTNSGDHHCGGAIISNRIIITAAHCVYQRYIQDFYLVTGTTSLTNGGDAYLLEKAIYHENFNMMNMLNDIALLKTASDIKFNKFVQPINLLTTEIPLQADVLVSGWGLFSWSTSQSSTNLQYVHLKTIDIEQCANKLFPNIITNSQVCTFTFFGQGTCNGDSGGPLTYNNALAGVVSYGRPCAIGYPDVFTKISMYINWINMGIAMLQ